jgi:hypothetical protein
MQQILQLHTANFPQISQILLIPMPDSSEIRNRGRDAARCIPTDKPNLYQRSTEWSTNAEHLFEHLFRF